MLNAMQLAIFFADRVRLLLINGTRDNQRAPLDAIDGIDVLFDHRIDQGIIERVAGSNHNVKFRSVHVECSAPAQGIDKVKGLGLFRLKIVFIKRLRVHRLV